MDKNEGRIGERGARVLYSLGAGQVASVMITMATFVIITRLLGPSDYGVYVFAFGFATLVDAVGNFGIGTFFSAKLAEYSYKNDAKGVMRTISSGYSLLFPLSLGLTILALAISLLLSGYLFRPLGISSTTLAIASLIIIFSVVASASYHALVGLYKGGLASASNILVDIVQLFASASLLLLGFGVNGALAGMVIGYAIGATVSFLLVLREAFSYGGIWSRMPTRGELRRTARYFWPLSINNFLNNGVLNFSIIFLGYFITKASLGNYGAALKGVNLLVVAYGTMSTVLISVFSTARSARSRKSIPATYNKILRYSLVITLPFIVYVGAFSKAGVFLLLSGRYAIAPLYLTLMAAGLAINLLGFYMSSLLASGGRTLSILKYNLASAAFQFAFLLALVPFLGAMGGILALFFIGGIVEDILFIRGARRVFGITFEYKKIAMVFICNGILAIAVYPLLVYGGTVAQLILGAALIAILYPPLLAVSGAISTADMGTIYDSTSKLPAVSGLIKAFIGYTGIFIRNHHKGGAHG